MAEPGPGRRPGPDPRAPWRVAFSVLLAVSVAVLFAPESQIPALDVNDKVVHGGLFLLLALTGVMTGLAPWPLLIGLVAYAGLSEVLQALLPIDRDGDVYDALTDVGGALVGTLVAVAVRARGASRR